MRQRRSGGFSPPPFVIEAIGRRIRTGEEYAPLHCRCKSAIQSFNPHRQRRGQNHSPPRLRPSGRRCARIRSVKIQTTTPNQIGEPDMKKILVCLILALPTIITLPISTAATAQKKERKAGKEPAPETKQLPPEQLESMLKSMRESEEIVSKLKFQQGEIKIKDGLATLKAPANFRYLDPDQSETVLVKLWGNPPSKEKTLGMLFPAEISPASPESWGVVITYIEDGYVKDDEAAGINYNDLLKEMQEGTREANPERIKQGYEAIELVGWAAPPHYDKAAHKLYWAQELSVASASEHTLNYDIRALGRRGVLSLNAIASMGQLQAIER